MAASYRPAASAASARSPRVTHSVVMPPRSKARSTGPAICASSSASSTFIGCRKPPGGREVTLEGD
jgi:hypothetical protein